MTTPEEAEAFAREKGYRWPPRPPVTPSPTIHELKREFQNMGTAPYTGEPKRLKEPTLFRLTIIVNAEQLADLEKTYEVESVNVANKKVTRGYEPANPWQVIGSGGISGAGPEGTVLTNG